MVGCRKANETAKLRVLQAAVQLVTAALEGGEFKEFATAAALARHLELLTAAVKAMEEGGDATVG